MSAIAESRALKQLLAGCHVSFTFGELVPNPDPTKRRCVHKQLFSNIICAVSHEKYRVAFDDGNMLECFLNRLCAESSFTSDPPDVLPPETDAAALSAKGPRAVLQVKNNSGLFPKSFIMDALENAPGGVHIVLKGTAPNGIDLVAIGYRYSTKTTLCFVATADAGSTTPGKVYEMIYTNDHGNVCECIVECPDIVSKFFLDSNT
jgi:hypothetical protein